MLIAIKNLGDKKNLGGHDDDDMRKMLRLSSKGKVSTSANQMGRLNRRSHMKLERVYLLWENKS